MPRPPQNAESAGASSTRTRIQQVAVELFAERGYDATSLREIAERLGVTKAALYYHFKSKDEIIQSLVEDQTRAVDEILAWARAQPRTAQTRQETIRRYATSLAGRNHLKLVRFFERNQPSLQKNETAMQMRQRMVELVDLFTDPDAPLTQRIRRSLAIFALHSSWFTLRDPEITDEQRQAAALEVALDLVS
ncbi:MAG TPA: helix-turn-helix domain-containing protein [Micromonosporaceae bacterium]|jgi:AcrR family transcriptional regulator